MTSNVVIEINTMKSNFTKEKCKIDIYDGNVLQRAISPIFVEIYEKSILKTVLFKTKNMKYTNNITCCRNFMKNMRKKHNNCINFNKK